MLSTTVPAGDSGVVLEPGRHRCRGDVEGDRVRVDDRNERQDRGHEDEHAGAPAPRGLGAPGPPAPGGAPPPVDGGGDEEAGTQGDREGEAPDDDVRQHGQSGPQPRRTNSRNQVEMPTPAMTTQDGRRHHSGLEATMATQPDAEIVDVGALRSEVAHRPETGVAAEDIGAGQMIPEAEADATGQKGPAMWRGPSR